MIYAGDMFCRRCKGNLLATGHPLRFAGPFSDEGEVLRAKCCGCGKAGMLGWYVAIPTATPARQ